METKLFGHAYLAGHLNVRLYTLTIHTARPYSWYHGYPNFGVHTWHASAPREGRDSTRHAPRSPEWLLRDRRTIAFADASGLQPVKEPISCSLRERVEQAVRTEHISMWRSTRGTQLVLNEPYGTCNIDDVKLRNAGLCCVEVPASLSPYCGGWNSTTGVLSGTRAFLIGDVRDKAELDAIAMSLDAAAAGAPAWNDVTEVRLVDGEAV